MSGNILMIFDWDDTLFPTYWLIHSGTKLTNPLHVKNISVYLKELDLNISKLLKTAILKGKVVIITNANIDWIIQTKKFLPETEKIIDNYIQIISARDIYHHAYNIHDWKKNVFKNNIYSFIDWADQIISFGDAEYEYEALVSLKEYISPVKRLKSVKLVSLPTFDILMDQINVIEKSLSDIVKSRNHLDLNFKNFPITP